MESDEEQEYEHKGETEQNFSFFNATYKKHVSSGCVQCTENGVHGSSVPLMPNIHSIERICGIEIPGIWYWRRYNIKSVGQYQQDYSEETHNSS